MESAVAVESILKIHPVGRYTVQFDVRDWGIKDYLMNEKVIKKDNGRKPV